MRRLPGPAVDRLGEEGNFRGSHRVVSGLAENTNSIFCDGSSELEAANGCPFLREAGTISREAFRAQANDPIRRKRALRSAQGTSRFSLDNDLHGCRSYTRNRAVVLVRDSFN
jgi:hypothetical protein